MTGDYLDRLRTYSEDPNWSLKLRADLRADVAKLGEHVAPVDDREPMSVNDAAEELYAYVDKRGTQSQFGNQLRVVLDSRQSWRYRAFKLEDDMEQMRADNAALLDGNQQLQVMNDGPRQMAIEAREAANGWHQATIDLYSGRSEPDPTGEEDRGA